MLPHEHMTNLFEAAAEAVQEAILNSLTNAETMTGYLGRTAFALPISRLKEIMRENSQKETL
jgi:D-aminopeptidase